MQPFPFSPPEGGRVRAGDRWGGGYEAAVLFQNAIDAALLAFLAGIPERMGYATDGRRLLLSRPVPVTEEILSLHPAEYYLRLLQQLGVPRPEAPRLLLRVTGEERQSMRSRLAGLGGPARGGGGGGRARRPRR